MNMPFYQSPIFYSTLLICLIFTKLFFKEFASSNDGGMILIVFLMMFAFFIIVILLGADFFIRTRSWTIQTKWILQGIITFFILLFTWQAKMG